MLIIHKTAPTGLSRKDRQSKIKMLFRIFSLEWAGTVKSIKYKIKYY